MRIALDPGATTGVAWRHGHRLEITSFGDPEPVYLPAELRATQWPGESIVVVLDGFHKAYGITEIVVENFRSRPGPAVNLSAPETIGRIEAWADQSGVPVIRQDASPVKTVVTQDRLRAAGGWKRGEEHARDATKHLLYREDKLGLLDIRQWPKEADRG